MTHTAIIFFRAIWQRSLWLCGNMLDRAADCLQMRLGFVETFLRLCTSEEVHCDTPEYKLQHVGRAPTQASSCDCERMLGVCCHVTHQNNDKRDGRAKESAPTTTYLSTLHQFEPLLTLYSRSQLVCGCTCLVLFI